MARKNPPLLLRSPLTGRVFIVNRYTIRSDNQLVSHEKYDVTAEFDAIFEEILEERRQDANHD